MDWSVFAITLSHYHTIHYTIINYTILTYLDITVQHHHHKMLSPHLVWTAPACGELPGIPGDPCAPARPGGPFLPGSSTAPGRPMPGVPGAPGSPSLPNRIDSSSTHSNILAWFGANSGNFRVRVLAPRQE